MPHVHFSALPPASYTACVFFGTSFLFLASVDLCLLTPPLPLSFLFFFNDTATTEIYTLSLHDALPICLIGSGPIVIGQAAVVDYAGTQALKVLREDGYRTIVVNSNPATIMTDPGFADRTYLTPLDLLGVADLLRRDRPTALLPPTRA